MEEICKQVIWRTRSSMIISGFFVVSPNLGQNDVINYQKNRPLHGGMQNKLLLSGKSKHILTTKNNHSS